MTLTSGQTLSSYEILGLLGAGGMGEVYRARDTRLEREVAIKVLPEELAGDEERLRRFEREAKTLASLNHPNVAGIHGIDQVEDTCFIAMELVEGEDLSTLLSRGALPVEDAVDVCRQIAEGLEAAHEAGVVHRDLKPANVRITPEHVVKILDFGLAKPIQPTGEGGASTITQTTGLVVTAEGAVLGTPIYMSPEQARGLPVDKRTDVWAFGCVLFECLTGRRAFSGASFSEVSAAILKSEPDWDALPAATPPSVRRLVRHCLDKDPHGRLPHIGEARIVLSRAADEPETHVAKGPLASNRWWLLSAVILSTALVVTWLSRPVRPTETVRTVMPRHTVIPDAGLASISPDGMSVAYAREGELFVRPLAGFETRQVTGVESARSNTPTFSPDGRSLAYHALRRG